MSQPLHSLLHGINASFFKSINPASYSKEIFTVLNQFLEDRSYLLGHCPSLIDSQVLDALDGASLCVTDLKSDFPHVTRWWTHINSLRLDPVYRHCFLGENEGRVGYKVRLCMVLYQIRSSTLMFSFEFAFSFVLLLLS